MCKFLPSSISACALGANSQNRISKQNATMSSTDGDEMTVEVLSPESVADLHEKIKALIEPIGLEAYPFKVSCNVTIE